MADDEKKPSWQTAIALIGLGISLFGNWVQYESLAAKKTELAQSQQKIDSANNAADERRRSIDSQINEMQRRRDDIDAKIHAAQLEERRGATGLALGRPTDADYAMSIMRNAQADQKQLSEERKQLQDKIDSTNTMKANCLPSN